MSADPPLPSTTAVLDGLVSPVCVLDATGAVVAANRAWRELEAAQGERAARQRLVPLVRELVAGASERVELEFEVRTADGPRWFVARAARLPGAEPPLVVVDHDDVSRQKQANETLRRSEALLQDLAASIPGALFRLRHGADGRWRFVYLGPGVERLFGVPTRQARADVEALWRCVLPEDRPAFDAALAATLGRDGAWEHRCRIETGDGAPKWIEVQASARGDREGGTLWTGVMLDVTEHQRLEAGLRASEETYRSLFETVPQGVVEHDRDGCIVSANPAAQRILGLTLDQLQGRTAIDPRWMAVHEDDSPFPVGEHPAPVALRTGEAVNDVVMGISRPDGSRVWLLVNATPLAGRGGAVERVYATFEDITPRVVLRRELEQQARTDYLTGTANRRGLTERLSIEFARVRRDPSDVFSVLALDLDHFKHVNDAHGHATGDAVLVHMAALMRQASRAIDVVARSGGEEFTLLLPDTGLAAALARAERLREQIEATPLQLDGRSLPVTVSIGVSTVAPGDASIDAVLARADRALYEAKGAGRNTVRVQLPPAVDA